MKAQLMSALRGLQLNEMFKRNNETVHSTSIFIEDDELVKSLLKAYPVREIILVGSDEAGNFVRLRVDYPQFETDEFVKKFKEKVGVKDDE